MKKCTKCGEVKPLDAYRKSAKGRGGKRSSCKKCDDLCTGEWMKTHREEYLARLECRRREKGIPKRIYKKRRCSAGYICLWMPKHPNAQKTGFLLEHVYVMSQSLGRPIAKGETIHHKNGIRDDNRLENLELWTGNHPSGVRPKDLTLWCIEYLKKNNYKVIKREKKNKGLNYEYEFPIQPISWANSPRIQPSNQPSVLST